ncbi:MAG TPA: cytochrome c biogenesis protein/redoxin [Candidatus Limnocylindrales bacterium]|nr:cytochrome c biogenesis protein/redoxin [Candidatus Limnocylindrales bacterium]
MIVVLGFAFVAGLLTILAPCTLPVVPLILGGAAGGGRRRIAGLFAGFATSFLAATVLVAAALASAGLTTDRLRLAAVALLGFVGLTLAIPRLGASVERRIPARLTGFGAPAGDRAAGLRSGFAIGSGIGLGWAPCVGPIMAAVIATAAVSGPTPQAVAIGIAYVVGAFVPLAAIARWGRRATRSIDGRRSGRLRQAFGVAMTASAVVVLTGLDVPLTAAVTAALPPQLGSALFAVEQQPAVQEGLTVLRPTQSGDAQTVPLEDLGPAPEVTGITAWINSPPTTLAALRGKVVLVHFWTFDCINCIHVQPYVKAWYDRYAAQGFVVLGIHTPELSFERDLDNVRAAVAKDAVRFPVAFDPNFATWNAYRNSYWPAFYFVDKAGRIRHVHFGEGDYDGSEAVIRELLAEPAPA